MSYSKNLLVGLILMALAEPSEALWAQTVEDYLNAGARRYERGGLRGALQSLEQELKLAREERKDSRAVAGLLTNIGVIHAFAFRHE